MPHEALFEGYFLALSTATQYVCVRVCVCVCVCATSMHSALHHSECACAWVHIRKWLCPLLHAWGLPSFWEQHAKVT